MLRPSSSSFTDNLIIHVDMDAFYASVEERENPSLKGLPLVVGGKPENRGVVAAANYIARTFGVKSAMPMSRAVKLCSTLHIVPPQGQLYSSISIQISDIFKRYTPIIEPLSLDEAFLDTSGSEKLHGSGVEIARKIKDDIQRELQLIASVGVAKNKFVAKLASDHDKPDGFTVVAPDQTQAFLDPLPVERIWGVGKVAKIRLNEVGIYTIKQLRGQSPEYLFDLFGKQGNHLWNLSQGIDDRKVEAESIAKSISQETTFDTDVKDIHILQATLLQLTEQVGYRLRRKNVKGRTISIKVRFDDFRTITRSKSIGIPTSTTDEIWKIAESMLLHALSNQSISIRLVGVGVSQFNGVVQQQLDLLGVSDSDKQESLDHLSDEIHQRFGTAKIKRGRTIQSKECKIKP